MGKLIKIMLILPALAFASGCMSYERVQREISQCPEYFQDNIGEIRIEPLSPWSVFFKGYVDHKEPNCPIHLLASAGKDTLLEEAFHSFEFRAGRDRYEEWERFYLAFHNGDEDAYRNYGGILSSAVILSIPFVDRAPGGKGKVNFHSSVSHFEDTAECFKFWMKGKHHDDAILLRKCKAVENFAAGKFAAGGCNKK